MRRKDAILESMPVRVNRYINADNKTSSVLTELIREARHANHFSHLWHYTQWVIDRKVQDLKNNQNCLAQPYRSRRNVHHSLHHFEFSRWYSRERETGYRFRKFQNERTPHQKSYRQPMFLTFDDKNHENCKFTDWLSLIIIDYNYINFDILAVNRIWWYFHIFS